MSNIDRQFDGGAYHYWRANGSDQIWTHVIHNDGVGDPIARLLDVYHRECVHVLSGNYTITYDRMKPTSGAGVVADIFRLHTINAPTVVGSAFKVDSGTKRQFNRYILSLPTGSVVTKQSTDLGGATSYRQEVTTNISTSFQMLTVTQNTTIAANPSGVMQAMSAIPGSGLPSDFTHRGVTIEETVYKHFLFGSSVDGTPTNPMRYYAKKNGSDDIHRVFNLKPGQEYLIQESTVGLPAGYAMYALTETFNTGFSANLQGILEYTPAQIGSIGTIYYSVGITDQVASNSDSTVTTQAAFNVGVDDVAIGGNSNSDVGDIDSTGHFVVNINDETTSNSTSTISPLSSLKVSIADSGGSCEETVTATRVGPPILTYNEKRIQGPVESLVPNGDLGYSFFTAEPNDGTMWNKVNSADNSDFIKPTSSFVQISYAVFSLTPPSRIRSIRSLQFAVRMRSADFVSTDSPFLHLDLYYDNVNSESNLIAYADLALSQISDSQWLRSAVIPVSIDASGGRRLVYRVRPRAAGYGTLYNAPISSMFVDVSGDPAEKVTR